MIGLASVAVAEDLIPPRRIILLQDTDMPGGDIASIFDTTLDACERACLDKDACTAMTFNTNNASCFAKSGAGEGASFAGALSGLVMQADATAIAHAPARRAELTFVQEWEMSDILTLARNLVNDHSVNGWTADDLRAASVNAEGQGDITSAVNYTGALVNLTDTAANWAEYSRLEFAAAQDTSADQTTLRQRAYGAAVNAYLRAGDKATRHTVLVQMAQVLEQMDRGRDTVAALRLAQSIQPRDDTAAFLADAAGKYGFRVQENRVESDLARPRLCVTFSEELSKDGVDYANYVKLDAAGLTVSQSGTNDLCVEGVEHGS
ncbi:MAG: alpha-2-macroglobulin family protein, partial [Rhodobacteraceae bacterium]|nr:alpha-2-macroglobulin family protein [Paracoccaceae bacterium]